MLLQPQFSEEGSNKRSFENKVYGAFTRYLREVAGGRRGTVFLGKVLRFATGSEEEPMLGFVLHPSIKFTVAGSFVPTANTCANTLNLPRPSPDTPLPPDQKLFHFYDLAFSNTYFGLI
ncbi:hypothetical protein DPMN_133517 [Dreissena polymorpha]|uniref:HECT domain-containing protein n=1 Tax=Dreissena polymorpha TaxID=45954 RepID=A0A9D4JB26_DREPO|nr:hypothetical protein DPMN_133517 [Dreissena polymorpha]